MGVSGLRGFLCRAECAHPVRHGDLLLRRCVGLAGQPAGPLGGAGEILGYFLAALVIAAYAEIMARVRKCPVTSYLLISSLPLVPGAGIYYTMQYALQGDMQMCLNQGMRTLGLAGSLAVGMLLMSSAVRVVMTIRMRGRKR